MSQQLVIPNFEIERLVLKFDKDIKFNSNPDLVIINKKDPILNKSIIDRRKFCKIFDGEYYVFFQAMKNGKCN